MTAVLPARIHDELAAARAAGLDFAAAWPHVVERVDVGADDEWRPVIDETAPAFLSAFERRSADRAELALLAVLDEDREPLAAADDPDPAADDEPTADPALCAKCGEPIPPERLAKSNAGRPVRFCSEQHRRSAQDARAYLARKARQAAAATG